MTAVDAANRLAILDGVTDTGADVREPLSRHMRTVELLEDRVG